MVGSWWRTVSFSGPQRPALAYERRSYTSLIGFGECFLFDFYCYFFTLRLYAWLLLRHVFLPGKSQILFAEAGSMRTISASREQQETF